MKKKLGMKKMLWTFLETHIGRVPIPANNDSLSRQWGTRAVGEVIQASEHLKIFPGDSK